MEYYEHTPQTEALQHYLSQRLGDTKEAELLTGEIHDMCMAQESFQDIFDYLDQSGVMLHSTADLKRLGKLIMDVWNNTRLWTNHGNTPQEMMQLERESQKVLTPKIPAASKKIGRNDPCPCGSGKKYKNCCDSN